MVHTLSNCIPRYSKFSCLELLPGIGTLPVELQRRRLRRTRIGGFSSQGRGSRASGFAQAGSGLLGILSRVEAVPRNSDMHLQSKVSTGKQTRGRRFLQRNLKQEQPQFRPVRFAPSKSSAAWNRSQAPLVNEPMAQHSRYVAGQARSAGRK